MHEDPNTPTFEEKKRLFEDLLTEDVANTCNEADPSVLGVSLLLCSAFDICKKALLRECPACKSNTGRLERLCEDVTNGQREMDRLTHRFHAARQQNLAYEDEIDSLKAELERALSSAGRKRNRSLSVESAGSNVSDASRAKCLRGDLPPAERTRLALERSRLAVPRTERSHSSPDGTDDELRDINFPVDDANAELRQLSPSAAVSIERTSTKTTIASRRRTKSRNSRPRSSRPKVSDAASEAISNVSPERPASVCLQPMRTPRKENPFFVFPATCASQSPRSPTFVMAPETQVSQLPKGLGTVVPETCCYDTYLDEPDPEIVPVTPEVDPRSREALWKSKAGSKSTRSKASAANAKAERLVRIAAETPPDVDFLPTRDRFQVAEVGSLETNGHAEEVDKLCSAASKRAAIGDRFESKECIANVKSSKSPEDKRNAEGGSRKSPDGVDVVTLSSQSSENEANQSPPPSPIIGTTSKSRGSRLNTSKSANCAKVQIVDFAPKRTKSPVDADGCPEEKCPQLVGGSKIARDAEKGGIDDGIKIAEAGVGCRQLQLQCGDRVVTVVKQIDDANDDSSPVSPSIITPTVQQKWERRTADGWKLKPGRGVSEPHDVDASGRKLHQSRLALFVKPKLTDLSTLSQFNGGLRISQPASSSQKIEASKDGGSLKEKMVLKLKTINDIIPFREPSASQCKRWTDEGTADSRPLDDCDDTFFDCGEKSDDDDDLERLLESMNKSEPGRQQNDRKWNEPDARGKQRKSDELRQNDAKFKQRKSDELQARNAIGAGLEAKDGKGGEKKSGEFEAGQTASTSRAVEVTKRKSDELKPKCLRLGADREFAELVENFDVIPNRKPTEPNYKYQNDVVRKKSERDKLQGWSCFDCKQMPRPFHFPIVTRANVSKIIKKETHTTETWACILPGRKVVGGVSGLRGGQTQADERLLEASGKVPGSRHAPRLLGPELPVDAADEGARHDVGNAERDAVLPG